MLTILGLGPGNKKYITEELLKEISKADAIYLRTMRHPSSHLINHKNIKSFDYLYENEENYEKLYKMIADILLEESKLKNIAYIVPGSPFAGEKSVEYLLEKEKNIKIINAASFIEPIIEVLHIDISEGFLVVNAMDNFKIDPDVNTIIVQVYSQNIASKVKIELLNYYDDDVEIIVLDACGTDNENIKKMKLYEMDRYDIYTHLTTIFIRKGQETRGKDISSLLELMSILRGENGCIWDKKQNHNSLLPFLIEESYEVVDAVEKEDYDSLEEELGDLLFQIVFHSQIAKEEGFFDFRDIVKRNIDKMTSRHSHIFSDERANTEEEIEELWQKNKKKENKTDSIPDQNTIIYAQKVYKKFFSEEKSIKKYTEEEIINKLDDIIKFSNENKISIDLILRKYIKFKLETNIK